jgi:transposase, IS5 family
MFMFLSGRKRGLTPKIKKELRRRNTLEPVLGHMKEDGKLGRHHLTGVLRDKINALLADAGHNTRIILNKLRELLFIFALIFPSILWDFEPSPSHAF